MTDTDAKLALQAAITAYFEATEPQVYVDSWVLVTHKESVTLSQTGASSVGMQARTDQSFVMTRGLLEIAIDLNQQTTTVTTSDDNT